MAETDVQPLSWPKIIAILLVTALVVGLSLGALQVLTGLRVGGAGVGAAVGVVGAALISQRRAALARHKEPRS